MNVRRASRFDRISYAFLVLWFALTRRRFVFVALESGDGPSIWDGRYVVQDCGLSELRRVVSIVGELAEDQRARGALGREKE